MADRIGSLVDELVSARQEFMRAFEQVDPEMISRPGLVGEWSGRELVAHLGYWVGHGTELIHAAEQGREPEGGLPPEEIEERNRTVAAVAARTSLATAQRREAGSFEALVARVKAMDPALLDLPVPGPGTLEHAIREDGPDHYREHAAALNATADAKPDGNGR